jgi:hypothetical protein
METGKTLTSETLMVCAGMCTKVHIKRGRWKWKNRAKYKRREEERRGENGNGCGKKGLQNSQICCDFVVVFSRS